MDFRAFVAFAGDARLQRFLQSPGVPGSEDRREIAVPRVSKRNGG